MNLAAIDPDALAPVLDGLRPRLEALFPGRVADVVLFGSRARGDHRPDSDVDVAVFLEGAPPGLAEVDQLARFALELEDECGAWVAFVPLRASDRNKDSFFFNAIAEDGRRL